MCLPSLGLSSSSTPGFKHSLPCSPSSAVSWLVRCQNTKKEGPSSCAWRLISPECVISAVMRGRGEGRELTYIFLNESKGKTEFWLPVEVQEFNTRGFSWRTTMYGNAILKCLAPSFPSASLLHGNHPNSPDICSKDASPRPPPQEEVLGYFPGTPWGFVTTREGIKCALSVSLGRHWSLEGRVSLPWGLCPQQPKGQGEILQAGHQIPTLLVP